MTHLPVFLIIIPLFTGFVMPVLDLISNRLRKPVILSGGILHLFSALQLFLMVRNSPVKYNLGNWLPPLGITLILDSLSSFFILLISAGTFLIALYSLAWIKTDKGKYFTLLFLFLAGMSGLI